MSNTGWGVVGGILGFLAALLFIITGLLISTLAHT